MDKNSTNRKQIDPFKVITVGLSWDEIPNQEIDLDLQCILLNELGQIDDAVYYNQLQSKISKIKLSEDSKGEKEGFDETLEIDLSSCPFYTKYIVLMICSFKEQPFSYVESSYFKVLQNNQMLHETSVGSYGNTGSLSILPCIFEKSYDGKWVLYQVEEGGKGKTFLDNENLIKKGLTKIGFDQILFEECKNWKGDKSFNLEKNTSLIIPQSLNEIYVGLGWDTRCDIDSSILLYSNENKMLENIYFGNKRSQNGSVIHHGDNLTGDGEGDDEVITIKLGQINQNVQTVWAVITIYSKEYQFDDVSGAYCRLFNPKNNSQFCKYNLSQNKDGVSTGNIMCCITRCQQGTWAISPKGFYVQSVHSASQLIPIINDVLQNKFSQVKTIEQIEQNYTPQIKLLIQQEQQKKEQLRVLELQKKNFKFNILIQSASGLASQSNYGTSDAYIVVFINGKQIGQTPVIKKSLNPVWNFKLEQSLKLLDKLEFQLYDHYTFFFDTYMGTCYHGLIMKNIEDHSSQLILDVLDKNQKKNNSFTGTLSVKIEKLN